MFCVSLLPDAMRFRYLAMTAAALAAAMLGFALYLQHVLDHDPCPLCVLQRLALIACGLICLVAGLHEPTRAWARRSYASMLLLASGSGLIVAGRHVWLQHLPEDQVPACGPGLNYMLDAFPFHEALAMVFQGSGECAEVSWRWLGLSIPEWTLLLFTAYLALALFWLLRPVPTYHSGPT